ncbi:MAG: hypothetical protein IKD70_01105, partial [Eggerthellaceae bacterium]|nr:hypothetical protein [Eggerthellaceae bacterium]
MKLNADIVYDYLSTFYEAQMLGTPNKALHLERPTFYMSSQKRFQANHLYVASADHLPPRPEIERDVVLVCIGESLQMRSFINKCTVIAINGKPDIFALYLAVQEVFDRYDAWNDELFELFKADADIRKIVFCSTAVFANPILVIDSSFRFIATASPDGRGFSERWSDEGANLSRYAMDHFLSGNDLRIDAHEPLFLEIIDSNALCVNLFDRSDRYIGCLIVLISERKPPRGLDALAQYLGRIIELSFEKNPSLLATEHNARKSVLQDLMDGRPIKQDQRWLLDSGNASEYVCISIHTFGRKQPLPQNYIAGSFEIAFPGSYALLAGDGVAGIVDLAALGDSPRDYRAKIDALLIPFLDSLRLCAGVSNDFSDLHDAVDYFKQAESALESGRIMNPQVSHHYYGDYALMEAVINSFSGAPIETFFPCEFRRILEHDRTSSVSFLETLDVVLSENMNYSRAAELL